jgi:glycogen debranching enzyme
MSGETVSILEGNTFVVSDRRGDIDANPTVPEGLFHQDTRFLSKWILTLNDQPLSPLSVDNVRYFVTRFFLVPGTDTVYVDSDLSVIRQRNVGDGFHEDLTVINHKSEPVEVELKLAVGADFADLFEVKDALTKKGDFYRRIEHGELILGYRRDRFVRETLIKTTNGADLSEDALRFHVHLEPHGQWTTCVEVVAATDVLGTRSTRTKYGHEITEGSPGGVRLGDWLREAPRLASSWTSLVRTYERSLIDLASLRYFPKVLPGDALPAAGLPWFMALFGRDSLLTSFQALPFTPGLAAATLRTLSARQGRHIDPFRDEEPGKILHESRLGEMTAFEERPHSPYFGSADATPLYLILLDEYERWSGDAALVKEVEKNARAALEWIDRFGDRDGDGYVDYQRRNEETGLENQCWKDSWNSIQFSDGTLPGFPRALCEIQGYVYDAKIRCARLAREIWGDPALAARLTGEAEELKRRFNEDFWLPDRGYYALARDGSTGRMVDALTSNIGHLLWSGIADEEKARRVVEHLMGPRLYSGWGVRTMAEGEAGYNPVGYHVGTVWPHDCSFIALGLRRYGYHAEAARLAKDVLDAAEAFDMRLPEAFAGYDRAFTRFPVAYPTACSPQAWSTGAPLLMLRVLLGLEPVEGRLLVDPIVPKSIARIELLDIPGRWGHADAFARGRDPNPGDVTRASPR